MVFASPEAAMAALHRAAVEHGLPAMAQITGLPVQEISSGDAAQDARLVQRFVQAHDERVRIEPDGDGRARVFLGLDDYPMASPLVRGADGWAFDSASGRQQLIDRMIGENELATIGVCRAFVQAQYEYYAEDRDGDLVLQYSDKLASSPGQRDGLYWPTAAGEPPSPLGALIARASGGQEAKPYHGYLFKVLTAQGAHAPGGAYDYRIHGRMLAGFALLAWPSRHGRSGLMTFLVGANGRVLQKNLGERTAERAAAMRAYDPGDGWQPVRD